MNVAVDVLSIRPDGSAGGATGYAIELIKGMAKRKDIKVTVLCADWNIEYLSGILPQKVTLRQMTGNTKETGIKILNRGLAFLDDKHRRKVLQRDKIDVLFCPFSAPTYRDPDVPTVSAILDIQHEFYPQFFSKEELGARRNFYRDIVANVERVVCISDYTKKTFCEKYGFPPEQAETVYIAVQERFAEEDKKILEKLNVTDNKYIVYSANFWEHKNHRMLLAAYAKYVRQGGTLKLVLTGNPLKEQQYYDDILKKMEISDMVKITGYVTESELFAILKHAKGIIYPSLFEGFGIPIVEAMQLNKLIACSNMTSLPEIGCDAIHYFDPRKPDDILSGIEFLDNTEISEEIISQYKIKLEDYKTDVMVEKYINIFDDTIKNRDKYKKHVFIERVQGIYQDNWTQRRVTIACKDKKGYKLVFKAEIPPILLIPMIVTVSDNNGSERHIIRRGKKLFIEKRLDDNEVEIVIKFSYTWLPRLVMEVKDNRRVSVHIEKCSLVGPNNEEDSLLNMEDKL